MTADLIVDREAHTYTRQGVRKISVTDALARTAVINTEWFTEASRERGKDVHEATRLYDWGALNFSSVTPEVDPFLSAWISFLKETGFKPDMALREAALYSEEYDVCGSPDAPGIWRRRRTIVEIKTGGLPNFARLQTAGYEILLGGRWDRVTVNLQANGNFRLKNWSAEPGAMDDRSDFLAVLRVAQWIQRNAR